MIALGGPKLKLSLLDALLHCHLVSMIALGGPKLKLITVRALTLCPPAGFNDSTGWA